MKHVRFVSQKRNSRLIIIGLILCMFILFQSCEMLFWDGIYNVKYVVSGNSSRVDLTIKNEHGGTSQYSDRNVPWEYEFSVKTTKSDSAFLYLSAQSNDPTSKTVITEIFVKKSFENDYSLFKTSTSNGTYVISTSSGSVSR